MQLLVQLSKTAIKRRSDTNMKRKKNNHHNMTDEENKSFHCKWVNDEAKNI